MSSFAKRLTDRKAQDFARSVAALFAPLPNAPKGFISFLVKIAPYMVLIGGVLTLLGSPLLGILSVVSFITFNPFIVAGMVMMTVFSVLSAVILFMAYEPLLKRKHDGWMLLFWSSMFSFAQTLLQILLGRNNGFGLIGVAIGFYIVFQMHNWYKK